MKRAFQIIFLLSLLLSSTSFLQAKQWRGITPLLSSRTDVYRILGKPQDSTNSSAVYSLADEEVEIDFSTKSTFLDCVKALPDQTVLNIMVVPKNDLKLSAFIDGRYKKVNPHSNRLGDGNFPLYSYTIGNEGYINDEEGAVIRSLKGNILAIYYVASVKDRKICDDYYKGFGNFGTISYHYINTARNLGKSASDEDIDIEVSQCISKILSSPLENCVVVNHGTEKEVSKRTSKIMKAVKLHKFDVRRFKFFKGENKSPVLTKIFAYPIGAQPELKRPYYLNSARSKSLKMLYSRHLK